MDNGQWIVGQWIVDSEDVNGRGEKRKKEGGEINHETSKLASQPGPEEG